MRHDENYTSFVVSLLVHKMGGGEGGPYSRGALILNFGRWEGRLFEEGAYFRIYGNCVRRTQFISWVSCGFKVDFFWDFFVERLHFLHHSERRHKSYVILVGVWISRWKHCLSGLIYYINTKESIQLSFRIFCYPQEQELARRWISLKKPLNGVMKDLKYPLTTCWCSIHSMVK